MAHKVIGPDLIVVVGGDSAWSAEDFETYLRELEQLARPLRGTDKRLKTLTFADKGRPSPKQRAELTKLLLGVPARSAMLAHDTIAQLLTSAFQWLDLPQRVFSPTSFKLAADYLELSPQQHLLALAGARVLTMNVCVSKAVEQAVSSTLTHPD